MIYDICHILKKKWEYDEAVHHIFIDYKSMKVLYNIFIQFGAHMQLV